MNDLNEGSVTLYEFLKNYKLSISDYQRPYVWTGKQIYKLYNDLVLHNERFIIGFPLYYIGTIILVKRDERDVYDIIDGQQRLVSLLIIAILTELEIPDMNLNFSIESDISKKKIKDNVGYLNTHISALKKIDFSKINITYIIAENQDQAFKFYTTLNTSGKALNGIDIIKPFHLQSLPKEDQNDNAIKIEHYQFSHNCLDKVAKCLLRIRYWNNFSFREFPYANNGKWKFLLPEEFSYDDMPEGKDITYGYVYKDENRDHLININYQVCQPLWKGFNTINYLLHHCAIWMKVNHKLNETIFQKLNILRGVTYNREYFEMCILAYVSRFGIEVINKPDFENKAKLFFKVCFDIRLEKPVKKPTIRDFEKETLLLKRILYEFEEDSIFTFCENFWKPRSNSEIETSPVIRAFVNQFDYKCDNRVQPFFNKE